MNRIERAHARPAPQSGGTLPRAAQRRYAFRMKPRTAARHSSGASSREKRLLVSASQSSCNLGHASDIVDERLLGGAKRVRNSEAMRQRPFVRTAVLSNGLWRILDFEFLSRSAPPSKQWRHPHSSTGLAPTAEIADRRHRRGTSPGSSARLRQSALQLGLRGPHPEPPAKRASRRTRATAQSREAAPHRSRRPLARAPHDEGRWRCGDSK